MIPELCVVKYQSVTKSDSHCIIKSGCKIRRSIGTSSSDELPDNDKRKPLGSLFVQVKCRVFERERTVYVGFSRYTVGYKPSETHLKPGLKRISQVGY